MSRIIIIELLYFNIFFLLGEKKIEINKITILIFILIERSSIQYVDDDNLLESILIKVIYQFLGLWSTPYDQRKSQEHRSLKFCLRHNEV